MMIFAWIVDAGVAQTDSELQQWILLNDVAVLREAPLLLDYLQTNVTITVTKENAQNAQIASKKRSLCK
jgi:hypothetical protein